MEKIKEMWNNRKTRGILFIIFYFLMFSYIFMVYGGKTEKIILPENKPAKEEKKTFDNYEYTYKHGDEVINVLKYNDIITFKIEEKDYYYINNKCYVLQDEKFVEAENPLEYNFDYLNNLNELKKISTLIKTSKYADETLEENYEISMEEFLKFYETSSEISEDELINYSIFSKDNLINKVVLNNKDVEINYINFENIPEININYEFYEGDE